MDVRSKILIIWVSCFLVGLLLVPYFIHRAKNKAKYSSIKLNEISVTKKYNRYSNNFLTRKRFHSIEKSYLALYCMSELEVKARAVKIFEKSVRNSLFIPIFILITTRNPIISTLCILVSMIYYNVAIEHDIDNVYVDVIKEISILVSSIQLNYLEYNNIPRSVLEADRGKYLNLIVEEIYSILTEINSKSRLKKFISKSPIKLLCELAEVCEIVNEYGDSTSDGKSKFIEQLQVIEKEVNLEIRVLHAQKLIFNSLDKIAICGIIFMPVVDWFLLKKIPGTCIIVEGVFGMVTKFIIILVTIASYYVISVINKKSVVSSIDVSEFVYKLSLDKKFRKFLEKVKPKSYKNVIKLEYKLEEALSNNNVDTFYTSKIFYSSFMFLLSLVLTIIFIISARYYIYNNTGTLSFIPVLVEKRVQEDIDIMDKEYMAMEEKPEGDDLLVYVEHSVRNINMLDIQNQADRLQKKWKVYNSITFKPLYVLLLYLMGVLGWFLPDIKMKLRRFMVKYEAFEDASQLQTVMITLSSTGISVYEILYRLYDLSTIHRSNLSYCCQTFIRDPEMSLEILSDSSNVPEFKKMCRKLNKSIYNLPVKDAFMNIVPDKEQSLSIKELDMKNNLRKKSNLANLLALTPVVLVLVLQAIAPLMILGFKQMMDMQSVLGSM